MCVGSFLQLECVSVLLLCCVLFRDMWSLEPLICQKNKCKHRVRCPINKYRTRIRPYTKICTCLVWILTPVLWLWPIPNSKIIFFLPDAAGQSHSREGAIHTVYFRLPLVMVWFRAPEFRSSGSVCSKYRQVEEPLGTTQSCQQDV